MVNMETIVALAKNRGFVFPGSDIYGGLANTWDYGPYGVELLNNIKQAWWHFFVRENKNIVGLDAGILMNPEVWVASGHVGGFSDPLIDCKECKDRFRADQIVDEYYVEHEIHEDTVGLSDKELKDLIDTRGIPCPNCGAKNFTDIRKFNMMFKTHQGVTEDSSTEIYMRPETAQGIFVNFKNVQRASRMSVPFGIAQIGKSFRNEITPGNFIFRTREFEQMELEFFCKPGTEIEWYEYWKNYCFEFLTRLGMKMEHLRMRDHDPEELSHYSNATSDIEYLFPFGWGELWGIASRTDFDLKQHIQHSGKDLYYMDPQTNEKYIPYVIEPSVGANRMFLCFLIDAYEEEALEDGTSRNVMRFHPALAPVKIGVCSLSKKLNEKTEEIYQMLSKHFAVEFDDKGSIGKRYRRFDEIGTPFVVTVDFDTDEDQSVTIRHRDTMEQVRLPIHELVHYFYDHLSYV